MLSDLQIHCGQIWDPCGPFLTISWPLLFSKDLGVDFRNLNVGFRNLNVGFFSPHRGVRVPSSPDPPVGQYGGGRDDDCGDG